MARADKRDTHMKSSFLAVACGLLLAGCASQPQSPAAQADAAACTSAADAGYQNSTLDQQARPLQNGLMYGGPNQVFDAERLGAMSQRDQAIQNCEEFGNQTGTPSVNGVPVVAPHIVN
ncbi:MAG: hypothetical protein KGL20_10155 [Rhodospirillales bacterium]|nr:hypothetical protein [Rhodospirillales bacterium]MDE2459580.1 hypothetical protein [Rhodospirillales bacterium]